MLSDRAAVDLILLDFATPDMNGADVAHEIRERRIFAPIVFLTGYADLRLDRLGEEQVIRSRFVAPSYSRYQEDSGPQPCRAPSGARMMRRC